MREDKIFKMVCTDDAKDAANDIFIHIFLRVYVTSFEEGIKIQDKCDRDFLSVYYIQRP